MNWDAVGAIGEVVGAMAVVVTLAYLAIQVRENSRQLRLTSTLSINSLMNEGFDPIYNNEKNMLIWTTGLKAPDTLDESDFEIFLLFMTRLMNPFETVVTHNRLGALDQDNFKKYVAFFSNLMRTQGGARWLASGQMMLSDDLRQALDLAPDSALAIASGDV